MGADRIARFALWICVALLLRAGSADAQTTSHFPSERGFVGISFVNVGMGLTETPGVLLGHSLGSRRGSVRRVMLVAGGVVSGGVEYVSLGQAVGFYGNLLGSDSVTVRQRAWLAVIRGRVFEFDRLSASVVGGIGRLSVDIDETSHRPAFNGVTVVYPTTHDRSFVFSLGGELEYRPIRWVGAAAEVRWYWIPADSTGYPRSATSLASIAVALRGTW